MSFYAQFGEMSSDADYEETGVLDSDSAISQIQDRESTHQFYRKSLPDSKPIKSILKTSTPAELRQVQFRSYTRDITFYHYSASTLPVRDFIRSLTYFPLGYEYSLLNVDPMRNLPISDGDEVPEGSIEVAYLPKIFKPRGSAVGFRDAEHDEIEWLCFNCLIEHKLDEARGPHGEILFDCVGSLQTGRTTKNNKGMRGHAEYKAWYKSIQYGVRKPLRLKLILRPPAVADDSEESAAKTSPNQNDLMANVAIKKQGLTISLARVGPSTPGIPTPTPSSPRGRVRFSLDPTYLD